VFIGVWMLFDDVCLFALVILCSKVIGIGKNYVDYVVEMGGEVLVELLMFIKFNIFVIGFGDLIVLLW